MCGIVGVWGGQVELGKCAKQMARALAHRGPDDEGYWVDSEVFLALGHRRLSILDLSSAGHQPMVSASGRHVIALNGEIYNHLHLRHLLEDAGAAPNWRGHSDTETLLAGFDAWGVPETLRKTEGMFAFAVWDKKERCLILARDRMGEKPLYYGYQGDAFIFASELKALRVHPNFKFEVNREALGVFLRHSYINAPHSIYQGVYKLLPGTFMRLSLVEQRGRVEVGPTPYWDLKSVVESAISMPFQGTLQEAVDVLEKMLGKAISGQMLADVPLGAFLSGGIDSSLIVALMQAHSSRPVKTFTIGFHESEYNEAHHAKLVARHLGTDHTELYVTTDEALRVATKLPALYDEPFADSSQIPTFLVSQLARRHVTVSLSGDGGDELFGGYSHYFKTRKLWNKIKWVPSWGKSLASSIVRGSSNRFLNYVKSLVSGKATRDDTHSNGVYFKDALLRLLACGSPEALYRDRVSHCKDPGSLVGFKEADTIFSRSAFLPQIPFEERMMYFDQCSYLPDDILVKVDRAAMGVSLETRVPFLDHHLVEFAWKLPLRMKMTEDCGKIVLRKLLFKYVPQNLVERPKMGFGVPVGQWLRGPLRDWAEELLGKSRLDNEGYLESVAIRKIWQEHVNGSANWGYYLWDVLMFQAWLEHYSRSNFMEKSENDD